MESIFQNPDFINKQNAYELSKIHLAMNEAKLSFTMSHSQDKKEIYLQEQECVRLDNVYRKAVLDFLNYVEPINQCILSSNSDPKCS